MIVPQQKPGLNPVTSSALWNASVFSATHQGKDLGAHWDTVQTPQVFVPWGATGALAAQEAFKGSLTYGA